jgi:hypothetical protein
MIFEGYPFAPVFNLDASLPTSSPLFPASTAFQALGVTGSGASGSPVIATSSSNLLNLMYIGQRFRIGSDEYVVSSLTSSTITITTPLINSYSSQAISVVKVATIRGFSGNGLTGSNGTVGNQPSFVESSLLRNLGSLGFDGVDDRLAFPPSPVIDNFFIGGGTFAAVIRPRTISNGRLFAKTALTLFCASNALTVFQQTNSGNYNYAFAINPDTSYIVVITFNSNNLAVPPVIYLNSFTGQNMSAAGTGTIPTPDAGLDLFVGNNSGNSAPYSGLISKMMIWKRQLNQNQIRALVRQLANQYNITLT